MRPAPQSRSELIDSLPPVWPDSLEIEIDRQLTKRNHCLVVLDEDPTGTQAVHGISVLTRCSDDELCQELARSSAFHLLTNASSLDAKSAVELNREVGFRVSKQRAGFDGDRRDRDDQESEDDQRNR